MTWHTNMTGGPSDRPQGPEVKKGYYPGPAPVEPLPLPPVGPTPGEAFLTQEQAERKVAEAHAPLEALPEHTPCRGCGHPRADHNADDKEPCWGRDVDDMDEERIVECNCLGWWEPGEPCPYETEEHLSSAAPRWADMTEEERKLWLERAKRSDPTAPTGLPSQANQGLWQERSAEDREKGSMMEDLDPELRADFERAAQDFVAPYAVKIGAMEGVLEAIERSIARLRREGEPGERTKGIVLGMTMCKELMRSALGDGIEKLMKDEGLR